MSIYQEYENPWLYKGEPVYQAPKGCYGFVYLITNLHTGRRYVGRKYFWTMRKRKGSKRRSKAESNWRSYYGSCKPLLEDISDLGVDQFSREILEFCETKGETNFREVEIQFKLDVLTARHPDGGRLYYNNNIMSRYFASENDTRVPWNKGMSKSDWKERFGDKRPPPRCDQVMINNGEYNRMIHKDDPLPEGFQYGNYKDPHNKTKMKVLYKDGSFREFDSFVSVMDELNMGQKTIQNLIERYDDPEYTSRRRKFLDIYKIEYITSS